MTSPDRRFASRLPVAAAPPCRPVCNAMPSGHANTSVGPLQPGDRLVFPSGSVVQVLELYRDGAYARLGYVVQGRVRGELENAIEIRCDDLLAIARMA